MFLSSTGMLRLKMFGEVVTSSFNFMNALPVDTYVHVLFQVKGLTFECYIEGVKKYSYTGTARNPDGVVPGGVNSISPSGLIFNTHSSTLSLRWPILRVLIDELRLSMFARALGDFTPPDQPFAI